MSTVAAIQMTSGHIVEDNLAAAGRLLREAKEMGAMSGAELDHLR